MDEPFPERCGNPAFTCMEPFSCADEDCGPRSPITDDGCLRRACTSDDECESDERCYAPAMFGDCSVTNMTECVDEAQGCVCTISSAEPSYCIAATDYPTGSGMSCASDCGAADLHSHIDGGNCFCDTGYTWCVPEDPEDFTCCPT